MCKFGEAVMWKPMKTAANRRNKGEPRWEEGCWMGVIFETDEAIIGTEKGMVRCRDVHRLSEGSHGYAEALLKVTGWPMRPTPGKGYRPIPSSLKDDEVEEDDEGDVEEPIADVDADMGSQEEEREEEEDEKEMRGMSIRKQDIVKYKRTKGCRACTTAGEDGKTKPGRGHSEACRKRMQERMKEDEVDRHPVEEFEQRSAERMAERVEIRERQKQ